MRIYLDNCCFGRPFDNQIFPRIAEETAAIIFIQEQIKSGKLKMATSYILHHENLQCPFELRRRVVERFLKSYSSVYVSIGLAESVTTKAAKFMSVGVKEKDACHVASAILAQCDYFLTVDDRLLKFKSDEIVLINPVEFVKILEANYHD
ncbi:MAG: hypothetical protein IKN16_08245 [Selenomonadaceae bacterium]|nr:hypothetical protein [Selenomonadaceae bacterium]